MLSGIVPETSTTGFINKNFEYDLEAAQADNGDDEEHDMMLDGGMHLMGGVKKPNCLFDDGSGGVTQVASECFDLNQFICKMDELVYS